MFIMDGFHLPDPGACEFVDFFADLPGGNDTILNFQQFIRPRHAKYLGLLAIGAAGGGAAGAVAADGTARYGGSGGGMGSFSTLYGPALAFPESMFIRVGGGGPGGIGNNGAGVAGGVTYVQATPVFSGISRIVQAAGAPGGGIGVAVGSAPTQSLGTRPFVVGSGLGGSTGTAGAQAAGASAGQIANSLSNGAAGGGLSAVTGSWTTGGNQAGQGANASLWFEDILFGGQTEGAAGSHGWADWRGFRFKGGCGGASSGVGMGGVGGDGAIGCGGGGGGAGAVSGGYGGRGGDGLVRIFWW